MTSIPSAGISLDTDTIGITSKFVVYAVFDPQTGDPIYIGQTNNLQIRKSGHRSDARDAPHA